MNSNKNNKLKQLHKTIDSIVKSRQIQKAKVDLNVMKEELTQEELKKFHKPMVDKLTSIIDTNNFKKDLYFQLKIHYPLLYLLQVHQLL